MTKLPPYITSKKAKHIKQLQHKKHRSARQTFMVQGAKNVKDLLHAPTYTTTLVVATPEFISTTPELLADTSFELFCARPDQLATLGSLTTNHSVLAVARCLPNIPLSIGKGMRALMLDDIRDPGNLGTLLRMADWYGIPHLICSPTTVDRYNPKVIQASMGSFTRVALYYTPLIPFLQQVQVPVIGALLTGDNLHQATLPKEGILLLGNEASGIHQSLIPYMTQQVRIPGKGKAASLNVAMAGAIICDHWCQ